MNVKISQASTDRLAQMQEIARRTIEANYRSFLGDENVDWFIGSGASDQYLADNINDCCILSGNNQIIGFVVCKSNKIDLMMIDNDFHRQGYGTKLLDYCEKHLSSQFDQIMLESFEGNAKANSFYRKNGWKEMERTFDEESGVNKILFVKGAMSP